MNAPDNEHAVILLHLADDVGGEAAIAGIDFARLQRASEGAPSFNRPLRR
jgi:hypothetical protein